MTIWMRALLWLTWLAGVGWFWHVGSFGTGAALAAALLGVLMLVAFPGPVHRRRRTGLQYVEMGKQPVGLL